MKTASPTAASGRNASSRSPRVGVPSRGIRYTPTLFDTAAANVVKQEEPRTTAGPAIPDEPVPWVLCNPSSLIPDCSSRVKQSPHLVLGKGHDCLWSNPGAFIPPFPPPPPSRGRHTT